MKAAVIVGKGKIEIEELPKPVPGPGLVLMRLSTAQSAAPMWNFYTVPIGKWLIKTN